jgi:hypothetical protein
VSKRAEEQYNKQKYADAERLVELWLGVQVPRLDPDDVQLATQLALLGACQFKQHKLVDAEKSLRRSLAINTKKAPNSAFCHGTESLLGAALVGQKKLTEAEPLLVASAKALIADATKLSPAEKKYAAVAIDRVIELYGAQGKADEAAQWRKRRDAAFAPESKEGKNPPSPK